MRKIIQLLSKRTAPFDFSRNDDKRNHEFASLQVTKSRVEHNRESKEAQRRDPDTRGPAAFACPEEYAHPDDQCPRVQVAQH